tara:strand:+ start:1422 stop:2351 length:930 start_codon:yes stop_codon:yes gene_type:complete
MARNTPAMKSDWDYSVVMDQLQHNGRNIKGHRYAVKLGQDGQEDQVLASGHSEQYKAVNNRDVVNAVRDAFDSANMNWQGYYFDKQTNTQRPVEQIQVTNDYTKMYARYNFMDNVIELPKVKDTLGLRLTAHNSFDRGSRVYFTVGAVRLVCTNGMTATEQAFSLFQKHSSKLDLKFIKDAVSSAMAAFETLSSPDNIYSKMAEVVLTQKEGLGILSNLTISEVHRKGIAQVWNSPNFTADADRTMYNLLNASTDFITGEVEGSQGRFELAGKTTKSITDQLGRLTIDPNKLDKAKEIKKDSSLILEVA